MAGSEDAQQNEMLNACSSEREEIEEAVAKEKQDAGKEEVSPLMHAVLNDDLDQVKTLLELDNNINVQSRFNNINVQTEKGDTALHLACVHKRSSCVDMLLKHNADVSILNGSSETALAVAIKAGSIDIVKLFIDRKLHLVDESQFNSLIGLAVFNRQHDILKLLLQSKTNVSEVSDNNCPLHVAVAISDVKTSSILLDAGINPNKRDGTGTTPLILAVRSRNLELVKILIKTGAKVDMKDVIFQLAPLHYATQIGALEIMKYLLWNGACINVLDKQFMTPLVKAVVTREECSAIYLIKENCNVNVKYVDSLSRVRHVFDIALSLQLYNLCKFLKIAGCNVPETSMESLKSSNTRKNGVDLYKWLTDRLHNPDSLMHCCRRIVRSYIKSPFSKKCPETKLPTVLQEYLMFPEVCINEDASTTHSTRQHHNVNPLMGSDFDDYFYNH